MRRYQIVLTPPTTSSVADGGVVATSSQGTTYDSQYQGQDNPAALDIAFDVTTTYLGVALPGSYVEVFGLSLQDISKVQQWQGGQLALYGGFSSGFPLAKSSQYGLLTRGTIQQAYGNWTGLTQSAVFILTPAPIDATCVFHWKQGQTLSAAVTAALADGYPGVTVQSHMTSDPTWNSPADDVHFCNGIYQLATYVSDRTKAMGLASTVNGIKLVQNGNIVNLYDGASTASPIQLDFNDLQGQPVYFGLGGASTAETTLNLRYDLSPFGRFIFPTQVAGGFSITQPANALAPLPKDKSALSGTFIIQTVRHVGRFRDPSGLSWVTIVDGTPT